MYIPQMPVLFSVELHLYLQMHYYIYCLFRQEQHHVQELKFDVLHHLQDLQKAICVINQKCYSTKIQLPFLQHKAKDTS